MGWMVRGLNSSGGEIFCTCPDWSLGPPSLLYNGYRVFPGGKEQPGRDAEPSPPSSAVGHKSVELYLYSPYGPYGLYRASVPVQGCSLPLLWVCVCSLRYTACNAHAPYCHLWPVCLYNIFPHYLINSTIYEKILLNTDCVFWFSLQLLSEIFLILRRI